MFVFWKKTPLAVLLCLAARLGAQSPATFEWLDAVKSDKNQRTLALLRAGPEGFHVLRWQAEVKDYTGASTPAHARLVALSPAGKLLDNRPVPTLGPGETNAFRFAVSNDSLALFAYQTRDSAGRAKFFVRRFDPVQYAWAGDPVFLFGSGEADFDNAWFSRSPDGSRCCVYAFRARAGGLSFALFDRDFHLLRKGLAAWPQSIGVTDVQRVFCANSGELLISAHTSGDQGLRMLPPRQVSAYRADGRGVWPAPEAVEHLNPFAAVVLLLPADTAVFAVFYPKIGKKYTPSFEFAQQGKGPVLCAGLASDLGDNYSDTYFIYQIEPQSARAEMLQNAPLPSSVRRAFPSAGNDADPKKPLKNVYLRTLDWAADGRPWLLVEHEAGSDRVEFPEAALLRLDSAWKITGARGIEKFQSVESLHLRFTGSQAVVPAPKGWWALWNKGSYPNGRLMLTDCKATGEPADYELAAGARLVLALLPHTRLEYAGKSYFVGESASGDRFGVGVLEKAGKK